jgi:prepilin-type N-terminal cleavage/methylation domain-containing protein
MKTHRTKNQSGFTLVEIAIVLVIIGLLLGGILKGQEMITQARIKNVANDFNGITAAYFSYQDRYKAVPGDDGGAAARWVSATAVNGDGDGQLAGNYNATPPTAATESMNFWWHLRLAGFVPGATALPQAVQTPTNAVGGKVGVQANAMGLGGIAMCSDGIPDKVAIAVDTQLDDQRRGTGTLRGLLHASGVPPVAANIPGPGDVYEENGSNQYVICRAI